jgi:hypothetical protein
MYKTTHPAVTWNEVQRAFISWFSEIYNEGQTATTLKYSIEYYCDRFLWFCAVISLQPHDIYLRKTFREGLRTKVKMAIISTPRRNLAKIVE